MAVLKHKMSIESFGTVSRAQGSLAIERMRQLGVPGGLGRPCIQGTTSGLSDGDISSRWATLRSDIHSLSAEVFGQALHRKDFLDDHEHIKSNFEALTPHWKALWDQEEFNEFLFQAHIWRFLSKMILQEEANILGPEFIAMKKLMKEKIAQVEQFHAWRSNTATLLHQARCGTASAETQRLVSSLIQELLGGNARSCTPDIRHRLHNIVSAAFELAIAFAKSKCDYQFAFEDPTSITSVTFRRVSMEMVSAITTRCQFDQVLLVLSPSLRRYGTPTGDRYNVNTLVCKASVFGGVRDMEEFRRRRVE